MIWYDMIWYDCKWGAQAHKSNTNNDNLYVIIVKALFAICQHARRAHAQQCYDDRPLFAHFMLDISARRYIANI